MDRTPVDFSATTFAFVNSLIIRFWNDIQVHLVHANFNFVRKDNLQMYIFENLPSMRTFQR